MNSFKVKIVNKESTPLDKFVLVIRTSYPCQSKVFSIFLTPFHQSEVVPISLLLYS